MGNEAKTLRNKIYPLIFNSFPPNHPRQVLPLLQRLLVLASTPMHHICCKEPGLSSELWKEEGGGIEGSCNLLSLQPRNEASLL